MELILSLNLDMQFPRNVYWKDYSWTIEMPWHLCQKKSTSHVFLVLVSTILLHGPICAQRPVNTQSDKGFTLYKSSRFFLFQNCFGYANYSYINFRASLSISMKTLHWIYITLGETAILKVLSHLIHVFSTYVGL